MLSGSYTEINTRKVIPPKMEISELFSLPADNNAFPSFVFLRANWIFTSLNKLQTNSTRGLGMRQVSFSMQNKKRLRILIDYFYFLVNCQYQILIRRTNSQASWISHYEWNFLQTFEISNYQFSRAAWNWLTANLRWDWFKWSRIGKQDRELIHMEY